MEPEPEERPTPRLAFERARQFLRDGRKLDMSELADEVGVGRSTLYRWTGGRDELLADAAWAELGEALEDLVRETAGQGVDYLERVANLYFEVLSGSPGLRAFFANEGDHGIRLVTAPGGRFRPRMVAAVRAIIEAQVETGNYRAPDDPQVLADGIISLGERFFYHGGDADLNPDPETARRVIALLLREPC
jgi:AcrR family transcriptional regulator